MKSTYPPQYRPGDGRSARAVSSRERLMEACTRMITEGQDPSAVEIAIAAGVGLRTLYGHFAGLTELREACGFRRVASFRQITLDDVVTAEASASELRNAAERARADGRLRHGNELAELADKLVALLLGLGVIAAPGER